MKSSAAITHTIYSLRCNIAPILEKYASIKCQLILESTPWSVIYFLRRYRMQSTETVISITYMRHEESTMLCPNVAIPSFSFEFTKVLLGGREGGQGERCKSVRG